MTKSIEEKYRKLSDIDHVLARPGMYVGSTKCRDEEVFLMRETRFEKRRVICNPAFLKIFDEIVVALPDEIMNDSVDYEDEFLRSWMTELPALHILSAEPFIQDDTPCWFVIHQMPSASLFFTVMTKYWEDRDPQSNFYRADFS